MTDTVWGPIGREVFDRTYARTKEDGTKETFDEVVERMVDGNCDLAPESLQDGERALLKRLVREHKIVPAGRHWWSSGVPGRQFLFNCHRAGWTDQLADHVEFVFDELMKGGGVGANYSTEYMERMHRIRRVVTVLPICRPNHQDYHQSYWPTDSVLTPPFEHLITVDDSREGWVSALGTICRLAQIDGSEIVVGVDVSNVRPCGSPIRGYGGTASGPGPLIEMLQNVVQILEKATWRRLNPIEAMEIDHAIASCVVAGNVRRSARMSIIHWRDPHIMDFIHLKANGGHWTTNISVEVDDEFWSLVGKMGVSAEFANTILRQIAIGMHRNGEPGIFNSALASNGERNDVRATNPCGEIALEEWENCNIGNVNLANIESRSEFALCARLVARWLIRATFADGMSWKQRQVVHRNRRIAVGLMGFQEWLWSRFELSYVHYARSISDNPFVSDEVEDVLESVKKAIAIETASYCLLLGIPRSIKTTTVAPTGTTAKINGVTEGIHPTFARYFIRRVRYAEGDPAIQTAIDSGLHTEPDNNNPNTVVVSYPCRDRMLDTVPEDKINQSDEITPAEMLAVQSQIQEYWSDNAISFTVNFNPALTSPEYIEDLILHHGPNLKGTTFMPTGSYEQAPIEAITREQFEAYTTTFTGSAADDCEGACPIK